MTYAELVKYHGASNHWRLGETSGTSARDEIGGANGTISGGVTLGQPSAITDGNKSMGFNGVDGKIQTVASISVPLVCTIEIWGKIIGTVGAMFATKSVPGATGDTLWAEVFNNIQYIDGLVGSAVGTRTITAGVWYHLVYILDGATVTFYSNGVFDRIQPFVRTTPGVGPCSLGFAPTHNALNGQLDEVAIYPRALTAQEIKSHYNTGLTNNFILTTQSIPCGPLVTMDANVAYALPSVASQLLADTAVQYSQSVGGSYSNLVGSNVEPGVVTVGGFIKCASVANVVAKRHTVGSSSSGASSSYEAAVLMDKPSYYWRLNEPSGLVATERIQGLNGTISGGVTLAQPGALTGDKAMAFGGVDGKIVTSGNVVFSPPYTLEFWIRTTDATQKAFIGNWSPIGGVLGQFVIDIFLNKMHVHHRFGATGDLTASVGIVPDGQWHHFVFTYTGISGIGYLDTVNVNLAQTISQSIGFSGPFEIGCNTAFAQFFNGSIDEVAVYPRALTPAEILDHYRASGR